MRQLTSAPSHRRLDVQGLRAIAVIVVVAFHAGLPVPGGFVGVDVFFVISGFVITAMLHREWLRNGRIRFRRFYLKRFRRLTPALALMVAVTMVASAIILSPFDSQPNAAQTGIGAMLIAANFVISRTTGGYFDAAAETNPLLNTWSLSVEEQFYLVFPAVMALGWYLARRDARFRKAPLLLIGGIAAISFGFTLAGSFGWSFPGAILGFYSPFTRAWEFAAGALLALALAKATPPVSPRFMSVVGATGIGMLAASLWLITETTIFPGPWTLLPVTGTLLLLFSGTCENPVNRTLGARPLVRIGDYSYSIYLWHWPFIVFAIYLWPFSPYAATLAAVISLAPAVASYHWVEQPIRQRVTGSRIQTVRLITVVTIPPILLAGLLGVTARFYWQPQYESGARSALYEVDGDWTEYYVYLSENYFACTDLVILENADEYEGIKRCWQSKPDATVDVALIGDSHAEHLFLGLAENLPAKNVAYYIQNGIPVDDGANINVILDRVAKNPSIQTVIISALWVGRGVPEIELAQTLSSLVTAGKQVFITDDVPLYPFDAIDCAYGASPFLSISRCTQKIENFNKTYATYYPLLDQVTNQVPGAHLLHTAKYFCNSDFCSMKEGNRMLYRDHSHLNSWGSNYLVQRLLEDNPYFKQKVTNE